MEKPRRQEQEPASDEVTEVAPGVLRMQLPIDMPGLGHVNCYALEDERGIAIVDPGLPGQESWTHLVDRLDRSGAGLARVHTVIVTHSHPDHFGGAGRVRHEVGAELVTHELFRTWWDPSEDDTPLEEAPNPWRSTPWAGEEYMPDPDRRKRFEEMRNNNLFPAPRPTRRVEDAEVVTLARREWVSMHTPGHTADHLCLFDPAEGVLLSGDHVLPTITPHISGIGTAEDPLAEFFASLDRMTELEGVTIVLPGARPPVHRCRRSRQGDPPPSRGAARQAARRLARDRRVRDRRRAVHNTSSRPGRGGRWPTARRTPTSSTCASSAAPSAGRRTGSCSTRCG